MEFRWNDWNLGHATRHGITPEEAEQVVIRARKPYPMSIENDKLIVWGRTDAGRFVQVVYVEDEAGSGCTYILHARPLTIKEKRLFRRRTS